MKALDIGDELVNKPKILRDDGTHDSSNKPDAGSTKETADSEGLSDEQELRQILKEKSKEWRDAVNGTDHPSGNAPREGLLSPRWTAYHRVEAARALGLVARCHAAAGAAVTAEGLFVSALDASASCSSGQNMRVGGGGAGRGVPMSSPQLGLIARDVRLWYAALCDNWERRQGDAMRLRAEAHHIEEEGVLTGYVRGEDGAVVPVSGLEASLWLLSPLD